jgi:hypothetical protein
MVHDAFGYDEFSGGELKKLKQLLEDMRYTRLSSTVKLLQLKAGNH